MGRSAILLLMRVIGAALVVSGIMWALQGIGILQWPANSFMLGESQWTMIGLFAFALGALLLFASHRLDRRH
ncbi:hypothetical protein ACI5KX_08560 [Erythrobacter sp. GH1-10]|uniref:hypothetical protein n=1 Tax=Erythrobacter sp. GH1-10 TaxID=3349334 RepID=UPI003877CE92